MREEMFSTAGCPTFRGFRKVGIDAECIQRLLGLKPEVQELAIGNNRLLQSASCPPFENREGWGSLFSARSSEIKSSGRGCSLSSSLTKNRSDHARTAATVKHSDHRQRFLIGCVDDHILAQGLESQRPRREIGPVMAYVGKRYEGLNRFVDFFSGTVRSVQVVSRDVFPDFVKIREGLRVENKFAHEPERRSLLFCRSFAKASSPSRGFTRPLLRSS